MNLSLVVPAHNEQDNIVEVVNNIETSIGISHELIIVNDHSQDRTRQLVEQLKEKYKNLRLVDNKSKKGFANALRTGFRNASCELVVPVMADLCDELATVSKMYQKIAEGYDLVCGSRYMRGGRHIGGPKIKGFFSSMVGRSLHYLLSLPTHDISNAFKMYRRELLNKVETSSEGFEISMEIPLKAYNLGFKITEVPTVWRGRQKGKSNFRTLQLTPKYLRLYIWALVNLWSKR